MVHDNKRRYDKECLRLLSTLHQVEGNPLRTIFEKIILFVICHLKKRSWKILKFDQTR